MAEAKWKDTVWDVCSWPTLLLLRLNLQKATASVVTTA